MVGRKRKATGARRARGRPRGSVRTVQEHVVDPVDEAGNETVDETIEHSEMSIDVDDDSFDARLSKHLSNMSELWEEVLKEGEEDKATIAMLKAELESNKITIGELEKTVQDLEIERQLLQCKIGE